MITPNFVKLPSGTYLNLNGIHTIYSRNEGKVVRFCFSSSESDYFDEDMTVSELDALLQPQGTPIVSPIPSEQSISFDKPFQFTFEGSPKHGLIDGFGYNMIDGPYIRILCDGTHYNFLMSKGVTVKV